MLLNFQKQFVQHILDGDYSKAEFERVPEGYAAPPLIANVERVAGPPGPARSGGAE